MPLSGLLEANLRASYIINLTSGTVVTPWKILGANYAVGLLWAVVGNTFIRGQVDIANRFNFTREGDRTDFADLVISPIILGWHLGKFHIMFIGNVYAPTGTYNPDRILNTSLNRWAIEPNLAVSWLHPKIGTEISAQLGYTINFQNPATKYTTGNELHLEWFVASTLPSGLPWAWLATFTSR